MPSLAIAAYAAAICSGVTSTLCPIGIDPYDEPLQSSGGSTRPVASPGTPSPVASPSPNFCW